MNNSHKHGNHFASSGKYDYVEGQTHDFAQHADAMLGANVLAQDQEQYGGYAFLGEKTIVARSTITGLQPVIEQAIRQIVGNRTLEQAAQVYGGYEKLESKIANQLTNLNDWGQLQTETQNEIMIMTGINFDGMSAAEQEKTINHLLHSPLPFGDIKEVLSTNVKIDMGYTHTLDKNKTEVTDLGDGVWKVTMISNNNNGSHTGHNMGSFKIDLGDNASATLAKQIGNSMVVNTNNNNLLYLDAAAREVLYDDSKQVDFDHPDHDHSNNPGAGHSFLEHASAMYKGTLIEGQKEFGGYAFLGEDYITARSTITGLQPVVEQAIQQILRGSTVQKAAAASGGYDKLEAKIAQQITNLNDWTQLTETTQAKLMVMTGINFDGMTTAERESTINHLLHSPLPFGEIKEVLSTSTKIDLGYTHTLDKNKTTATHLGDGIYEVSMISNNNNGSHTGHNMGSFKIDLSGYPRGDGDGQYATSATASSTYGADTNVKRMLGKGDQLVWWPGKKNEGEVTVELGFDNATKASGVIVTSARAYSTGALLKVELRDEKGKWHTVWTGSESSTRDDHDVELAFKSTDFKTKDVRLTIDTDKLQTWEAIDSVKLLAAVGDDDGSGRESKAIELGNRMVVNTNDNTKLYLDQAARDVLYGNVETLDFDVDNPYQIPDDDGGHGDGDHGDGGHDGGDGDGGHDGGDHDGMKMYQDEAKKVQYLQGETDNDVFVISGKSSKYGWEATDDGGVVVWNDNYHDILYGFEKIKFKDQTVDISALGDNGGGDNGGGDNGDGSNIVKIHNTDEVDYVFGTDAREAFVIDGDSADYSWAKIDDGGYVVWSGDDHDILYDVEEIHFNDTKVVLVEDDNNNGGGSGSDVTQFVDNANEVDYVVGTDGKDQFVIDGKSSDYNWGATDDGGTVVWSGDKHDILYDVEEIKFNDEVVTLDEAVA